MGDICAPLVSVVCTAVLVMSHVGVRVVWSAGPSEMFSPPGLPVLDKFEFIVCGNTKSDDDVVTHAIGVLFGAPAAVDVALAFEFKPRCKMKPLPSGEGTSRAM